MVERGQPYQMEPSNYDDFEPYCKWERHESDDVLIMHLPDFKRNELKIEINKFGVMTVSGECQPSKTVAKSTSRFTKRIRISSDYYNEEHIHAKFVSGILYITMPHNVLKSKTSNNLKNRTTESSTNSDVIINDMPSLESVKKRSGIVKKNAVESYKGMCKEMSCGFGSIKRLISDEEEGQNVALVVASVVVVSSLGAYVVYKLWSGSRKT